MASRGGRFSGRQGRDRAGPSSGGVGSGSNNQNLCRQFQQRGTCSYGDRCKFSHGDSSNGRGAGGGGGRGGRGGVGGGGDRREKDPIEQKLNELTRVMSGTLNFTPSQAEHFLNLANEILEAQNAPAFKQKLITQLAEETGLEKIVFFVEAKYFVQNAPFGSMSFWKHCVPFLKIISNDELRSSLVLENAVGTIYNILYGHSGARAIPFFTTVGENLLKSDTFSRTSPEFTGAVCATMIALEMMLNVNQSAMVQKEFGVIVKNIRGIFQDAPDGKDHSTRIADLELRRVEQKLGMGEAIPVRRHVIRQAAAGQTTNLNPVFRMPIDFPGGRSRNGPRHDNDKESIIDIRILPTKGEIMSDMRSEYRPTRDYDPSTHHLAPGIARILDTQFRLLREDTSGQLRDAIRFIVDALQKNPDKHIRTNGLQTAIYRKALLKEFKYGDRDALHINVTFDQPQKLKSKKEREQHWGKNSKLMQTGSLVCLIDNHGGFTFALVADRLPATGGVPFRGKGKNKEETVNEEEEKEQTPSSQPKDLISHPTRALVTLKLVDGNNDLRTVVREYHRQWGFTPESKYVFPYLVEFPGMLFASFEPILKFLQRMISAKAVPFSRLLAPEGNQRIDHPKADPVKPTQIQVPPPLYLTKGVTLDLSIILKKGLNYPLRHSIMRPVTLRELQVCTELDTGQCEALLGCLTRELALIQGPPGTGKSFLGVKLCKVLLNNNAKLKLGPIICVCYTNHALDQFLVDLLDSGVENIIRLGSRSKEERLKNHSLRVASQTVESTFVERGAIRELKGTLEITQEEIVELCTSLNRICHWTTLRNYLEEKYPSIFKQLFGVQVDEDGFKLVSHRKPEDVLDDWIRLRHLPPPKTESIPPYGHHRARPLEQLVEIRNMSILTSVERLRLRGHWENEIRRELVRSLRMETRKYEVAQESLRKIYQERDRRCLHEAQVIGVTTTGLAGNAALLQKLTAKVLVCEEAGEVLEAHTITALLPSVEHAILIGDHKQLRPHIANYELSVESNKGQLYKLDESLFERLTREKYGENQNLSFPFPTLDTQWRMHPSISNLVKQTLYPHLKDHPTTNQYPEVEGMARRLFWMNHAQMESNSDKSDPNSVSKTNIFEVEMVAALVKHLIKQGKYVKEDIVVLTPYLGQLKKMQKKFRSMFEILVGEKDQEQLDLMGDSDEEDQTDPSKLLSTGKPKPQANIRKGDLLSELRLSTVDNFQGEQAKVVVVSLVRCNPGHRCGFLKTSNRINVLLSRAKHGMYIIGNTDTARPIEMWAKVLSLLDQKENVGDAFELKCRRHPYKQILVKDPNDFLRFSPEGGCDEQCGKRLEPCGHSCTNKCHSDMLHQAVTCKEDCTRSLPGCNHPCPIPCGEKCLPCVQPIPAILLPCGHISYNVPCHQAQNPDRIVCRRSVVKTIPGCKHSQNVACFVDVSNTRLYKCQARCNQDLPCGHKCIAKCHECRMPPTPREDNSKHVQCRTPCSRPFNTCEHSCSKVCHEGEECGVCEKPCDLGCSHSKCTKKCTEACTPCAEQCSWGCVHQGKCVMPCAVPCEILPCSKRCAQPLRCGHQCPSICGEKCPDIKYCRECATPEILETVVDMVCMETYRDIDDLDSNPIIVLSCGHFFTMETVDGLMQMRDVYDYDIEGTIISQKPQNTWIQNIKPGQARCPSCRGPFTEILRYNRVVKGIMIEAQMKKFLVTAHRELLALESLVSSYENNLSTARARLRTDLTGIYSDPTPENSISNFISTRHSSFLGIRKRILAYIASVTKEEQPYGLIHRLVTDRIRRQRVTNTSFVVDDTSVVLRNGLLGRGLYIRTYWAFLYDILKIHGLIARVEQSAEKKLHVTNLILNPLERLKTECKKLEVAAAEANQPRQQVEAKLYHTRFAGLELKFPPPAPPEPSVVPFDPSIIIGQRGSSIEVARQKHVAEQLQKQREYQEKLQIRMRRIQNKRQEELRSLDEAVRICRGAMGSTAGLLPQVEQAKGVIRDLVFYSPVTSSEQQAVYDAMRSELRGTGHWYYCENRHPFTIGDCGMPMEQSRCPQCDAPIGGQDHITVAGVVRAEDLEARFATMGI